MPPISRQSGSPTVQRNFKKLANTGEFRVNTVSAGGAYGSGPFAPEATETFSAAGAYDKVLTLAVLTLLTGIGAYLLKLPPGFALLGGLVALGAYFFTVYRPTVARYTAPLYAVAQGVALGVLSQWAALQGFGVVALALLGTVGIYFGVLALYRSGLVRVTPTFLRVTLVIVMGTMFAAIGSMIFSYFHVPLLSTTLSSNSGTYMIFGVLYLVSGIMTLFADFAYIDNASASKQINRQGEWFAAMLVLVSMVMIFLGLLRILGAFGGGRR